MTTLAGSLYAAFQSPSWDDLRFPVQNLRINPATTKPDYDQDLVAYLFDAATTETVSGALQLPHDWNVGTELKPHVHWYKTTAAAGAVYWQLEYKWHRIGQVVDAEWTTLFSAVAAVSDGNTANQHAITALGAIPAANNRVSDMIIFKVSRVGGNAADTYAADVGLLEFDVHYQRHGLGSEREFG